MIEPENEITKPKNNRKKAKKTFVIEARWHFRKGCLPWMRNGEWHSWKKYETAKQRDNALVSLLHSYAHRDYIEFRKGTP